MTRANILSAAIAAIMTCALPAAARTGEADGLLGFLYAGMPVSDSIDYPRSFWEENVNIALRARAEMPWGKNVPEREFRHFVLPVRVNNEDLDSARMVFYRELAPRVIGLSMHDAALEVNHWCHEKMNYRPSDSRTSSPLASMRTTWGRCGEESTFAVAAMRSVGIPARQVYTPRWAHTDDNHAWVEVWVDGNWHFIGACEPEPVLDLAWFNAPAARGMLMATNAFGRYDGPEQKLYTDSCYTRINVTGNYAPLRRASVKVTYADGSAAAGVPVSFRLYNYAELYPLFSTLTDSGGRASLMCGKGDIVAWATDSAGKCFGFAEIPGNANGNDDVVLVLTPSGGLETPVEMTLTPPLPSGNIIRPSESQIAENSWRFAVEDSLRNAVAAHFFTEDDARRHVDSLFPEATQRARMAKQLAGAYGNGDVIDRFLRSAADPDDASEFLALLSDKDLRDVDPEVLDDAYLRRVNSGLAPVNPRIANERLTPFCSFFNNNVPDSLAAAWRAEPENILHWIDANITVADARNPNSYCISPAGVWRSRMADRHSRNIFFVALCRWLDIPARINPVTGATEWGNPLTEINASASANSTNTGVVNLTYASGLIPADPVYYTHFTVSRLNGGEPQLLGYPDGATLSALSPLTLAQGDYIITTGRRMADGAVAARMEKLTVTAGDTLTVPLTITDRPGELSVIGTFNADPLLPVTGRGFFVLAVIAPGHEPSTHLLNELIANRETVEKWGGKVVLLFTSDEEHRRFNPTKFPGLPNNVVFGVDTDSRYLSEIAAEFGFEPSKASLPALIIGDTFNRVVFRSSGYNVGLGDRVASILPRLP